MWLVCNGQTFSKISKFEGLWKKVVRCDGLLKHLSHIHGSHPGSSRILIRDHPACNAKIFSQCRCEYVANWALIRISTVSIRIDKAATRTSPERPRRYTDEHGSNWAFTRSVYGRARSLLGIPTECWRCVDKRWHKLIIGNFTLLAYF